VWKIADAIAELAGGKATLRVGLGYDQELAAGTSLLSTFWRGSLSRWWSERKSAFELAHGKVANERDSCGGMTATRGKPEPLKYGARPQGGAYMGCCGRHTGDDGEEADGRGRAGADSLPAVCVFSDTRYRRCERRILSG